MHTLRKFPLVLPALRVTVALSAVMVLAAGPALATESGEQTATEEGAEHGEGGVIVRNEDGGIVLPLDPERPRGAVGWGLIALTVAAGMAALINARKQLRGEREQATGEWRYR